MIFIRHYNKNGYVCFNALLALRFMRFVSDGKNE